jgi:hypothetical protein
MNLLLMMTCTDMRLQVFLAGNKFDDFDILQYWQVSCSFNNYLGKISQQGKQTNFAAALSSCA